MSEHRDWEVRDRKEKTSTTLIEEGVSKTRLQWSINRPLPPFVFGEIVALFVNEEDANRAKDCVNACAGMSDEDVNNLQGNIKFLIKAGFSNDRHALKAKLDRARGLLAAGLTVDNPGDQQAHIEAVERFLKEDRSS